MSIQSTADFIISTGETHTIEEYVNEAFRQVGINPDGKIKIDPNFARPGKQPIWVGDISKAEDMIGFNPKVKFKELIKIIIDHDLKS